ncbi:DNA-binding response regulator [bacterium]|nr:DNA-binding response regulator [bacterium]
MKILMIEDDEAIRTGLKYYLEQEKFEVIETGNGKDSLKILIDEDISICLLDVNLPDINGFDLFKKLKEIKDIPIIFLTANDLETSIVMGLDMGADDYVTKPFRARELISRIHNALRKKRQGTTNIIHFKNITVDLNGARVLKDNKDVFLTALEYKIVLTFFLNPNVIFTREKILADIWDVNEEYVNDNTLTVYIKRIREKLEKDPTNPEIIVTVRGIGYKLGEENAKR